MDSSKSAKLPVEGERYKIAFTRSKDGQKVKRNLVVLKTYQGEAGVMVKCRTAGTYRTSGWKTYRLSFFLEHSKRDAVKPS